jgi:hypothetical protein
MTVKNSQTKKIPISNKSQKNYINIKIQICKFLYVNKITYIKRNDFEKHNPINTKTFYALHPSNKNIVFTNIQTTL